MKSGGLLLLAVCLTAPAVFAQSSAQTPPQQGQQQKQSTPPVIVPGLPPATQPPAGPATAPKPAAGTPATVPGQEPATPAAAAQTTQPAQTAPAQPAQVNGFEYLIPNASLTEFIDIIAQKLKINYILDKDLKGGSVTLYTYGEVKPVDLMTLLQTVLRMNGATMVQVGDLYRIVPFNKISSMPLPPETNIDPKTLPDDERMVLDLIFLKYATAKEIDTLIAPFLGEGASHSTYEPANLLILQDNARNMKRTLQLIDLFDSDALAGQRVRLFEMTNSRPSDIVKDLDTVFKAFTLSDKASAVKFIPVDRINTLIAMAPNPGIFPKVQEWIDKLDVPVKITSGEMGNFVYRLKYARAETVAMAIMALYTGNIGALINMAEQMNSSMFASGIGMNGGYGTNNGFGMGGGMGMGGYGGGFGMGSGGGYSPYGNYGGGGYGGFSGNGGMYNNAMAPQGAAGLFGAPGAQAAGTGAARDQTGNYLGNAQGAGGAAQSNIPRVVPNPFDNTLIIQGSQQDIEQIKDLLRQLDVAPRQILIDAKIYEVDLTGDFSAGVESALQKKGTDPNGITATAGALGLGLTMGNLVSHSKQLFAILNTQENTSRTHVLSAPSIIATDSVPATMNVGDQVPVATSQAAVGGVTVGGTTPFANTIGSASTGVTFSIVAHANSSGIVTMMIDQQVSAPEPPPIGVNTNVESSSFSNRSVSTQITVQDGDTVAIGGIITEKRAESSGGIPLLHRIPILGAVFGSKALTTSRTELIIFLTPRVIYDTSQMTDATDEIRSGLKRINKLIKDSGYDQ